MRPRRQKCISGFSLLEMLISTGLTVVLMASTLAVMNQYYSTYGDIKSSSSAQRQLRGAMELVLKEAAQAGALASSWTSLSQTVVGNPQPQQVAISPTDTLYSGIKVLVGTGGNREMVTVSAVTQSTLTAVFTKNHNSGTPVFSTGVMLQGILSNSTASQLELLADLEANGDLSLLVYRCSETAVTRSVTPVNSPTRQPYVKMLDGLTANPNGTPCFRYKIETINGNAVFSQVRVTLSVQVNDQKVQTASFAASPRAVTLGKRLLERGDTEWLQNRPAQLPSS